MIFFYVTILCITLYFTLNVYEKLKQHQPVLLTPTPVPIQIDRIPDHLIIRDQNQNQFVYFLTPYFDPNE